MILSDNLLGMTRHFISPDVVMKFCLAIGEPYEKTRTGLQSAIPTLIMGIVDKGQTQEGAESVVNMAKEKPLERMDISSNVIEEDNLNRGTAFLSGVFGNNLNTVVSNMGASIGMKPTSVKKMLSLAAPLVLGIVGSKVKQENLTANGLVRFFNQQKGILTVFFPEGISKAITGSEIAVFKKVLAKNGQWMMILLIVLSVLAVFWWFLNRDLGQAPKDQQQQKISKTTTALSLKQLTPFLKLGTLTELPKRFRFENLTFKPGSMTLASDDEYELDIISNAMKEYPSSKIRLEGLVELANRAYEKRFSLKLATTVKKHLVIRGIEADRIEVLGRGSASGRDTNPRVELVVTDLQ